MDVGARRQALGKGIALSQGLLERLFTFASSYSGQALWNCLLMQDRD